MAFTNPSRVQGSLLTTGALTAIVGHQMIFGLLDDLRAVRTQRADNAAMAAWDHALGSALHSARTMSELAKNAVSAALDAQDEAEALRVEVAQLRRAVAQRDSAIRALA